ncbi:pyrroloquinoline quinone precursor peptide PqqA [Saccharopolyspora taberi]
MADNAAPEWVAPELDEYDVAPEVTAYVAR